MKLSLVAAALTFCLPALGHYNGAKNAATINSQATVLKPGKYRFVNVESKEGLTYVHSYQQLYAAPGKGSWMSVKTHEHHVILSPSSSNNKCFSAQWNYAIGADWAAALYACKVAHFKKSEIPGQELEVRAIPGNVLDLESRDLDGNRLEKRVALRDAKQYFYIHRGKYAHTYHIIAEDHLTDAPPRAVSDCHHEATSDKRSKIACMVALSDSDKSQLWYVYNSKNKLQ